MVWNNLEYLAALRIQMAIICNMLESFENAWELFAGFGNPWKMCGNYFKDLEIIETSML